ncbi:MAG: family 1 glycosylhydrolase [Coriobacteriia bacterium]|nr:family 1 glycosylhydrolase [Coriobacteriia bacterium]
MNKFPKEFLIGAATAGQQVEGNNDKCDVWAMEHIEHSTYNDFSGDACDHYHRYEEDLRRAADAGLNAYRFSIEWSRVEPEEGVFDEAEIDHYRRMIRTCRELGLEPMTTLMHFTSPVWLIKKGGWEAESTVADFARYAGHVATELADDLGLVCTINEANMGTQIARLMRRYEMMARLAAQKAAAARAGGEGAGNLDGNVQMGINLQQMMEQQKLQAAEYAQVFGTPDPHVFQSARTAEGDAIVMRAHQAAREAIRAAAPNAKVGLTLSLHDIQWIPGGEAVAAAEWGEEFTHYLPALAGDDFLGVQNYARAIAGPDGDLPVPEGAEVTQAGYEYYPQALEHVLRKVAQGFEGTLYVTENGIATDDDERRREFISSALGGVRRCLADGLPIGGYFYWSLLDNWEWQHGYSKTFGLIAVDRETQKRSVKPSLFFLGGMR